MSRLTVAQRVICATVFSLRWGTQKWRCTNLLQKGKQKRWVYATIGLWFSATPECLRTSRTQARKSDHSKLRVQRPFFTECASGGRWDRPELQRLLEQLRPNGVVLVWKLDRLSRSLKDLLTLLERIEARGAGFKSLTEAIDTTTPAGRMRMQMVGAFAAFERAMIRERTLAGLKEAKVNGRTGGRRKKLKPQQEQEVVRMVLQDNRPAAQVARLFDVHPATVGRIVARYRLEANL